MFTPRPSRECSSVENAARAPASASSSQKTLTSAVVKSVGKRWVEYFANR
jgi:hypothetical protein